MMMKPGYLILQDGTLFAGLTPHWNKGVCHGEVVFTTGMTGYYESLTDPSYSGQILVFTYPLMGNYGVPMQPLWESQRIHATGVVVGEACVHWSHAQGFQSLQEWLKDQNVPIITGIDTRQLTKILREAGVMPGAINIEPCLPACDVVYANTSVARVSPKHSQEHGAGAKRIILVDCGMKANILRSLLKYPVSIKQVPHDYDFTNEPYDGIFISNGPGDPQECQETIEILRKAMQQNKPIYGICLGAQLLALAGGASTYKLRYGHRGHNQPCIDTRTQRCYITSQNHGYAINAATLPEEWMVTFRSLNDDTVEGISHRTSPFHAVQFHPEAAPGPTDTQWFFEQFYASL